MKIVEKINELSTNDEKPRRYIGASVVGTPCTAELALSLRGFPSNTTESKLQRIFNLGHLIEEVVISDMRKAGFNIEDRIDGKQVTWKDYGGHVIAHGDGIIFDGDRKILCEIKSMNDSKFKEFMNKGVRVSHPKYYDQIQMMLGMGGMEDAVLVAYNKNNSDYHAEYIKADFFLYSNLRNKIEVVLRGSERRIAVDRADWRCKSCFKSDACWGKLDPEVCCATCTHASPAIDRSGQVWNCSVHDEVFHQDHKCENYVRYTPRHADGDE